MLILFSGDPVPCVADTASPVETSHMEQANRVNTSVTNSPLLPGIQTRDPAQDIQKMALAGGSRKLPEDQGRRGSLGVAFARRSSSAPALLSGMGPARTPRNGPKKGLKQRLSKETPSHEQVPSPFLLQKGKVPHQVSPVESKRIPFFIGSKNTSGKQGIGHGTRQQNLGDVDRSILCQIDQTLSKKYQGYTINIVDDPVGSDKNLTCDLLNANQCCDENQDGWRECLYALIRFYGFRSLKECKSAVNMVAQRPSVKSTRPTHNPVQRVSHGQRVLNKIALRNPRKAPDERFWHVFPMPWQQSFLTMTQGGMSQFGALELNWFSSGMGYGGLGSLHRGAQPPPPPRSSHKRNSEKQRYC
ncbi:hypothetical protein scyTo_0005283 [Scyliorhinus torazame]|uniref:Uncharacterized protein n=1 Tax=Scyliorhinus torazame TaxID=75743 RepID=A0A401P584_SCYTO|nr:hypothetical protein [Scyliorhinus torazame]